MKTRHIKLFLLALILLTLIIGGYVLTLKLNEYKLDVARQEAERVRERDQLQKEIASTTAEMTAEIENLKRQVKQTEAKVIKQVQSQNNSQQNIEIKSSDIEPYLEGVQQIECFEPDRKSGSSSFWNIDGLGYVVLTNYHVISGSGICNVFISDDTNFQIKGLYRLNKSFIYDWNSVTDTAALKIEMLQTAVSYSKPVADLNYKISFLKRCPVRMPIGSPVVALGYPAYTQKTVLMDIGVPITMSFRTLTNGIISAYDTSVQKPTGQLPYSNYYVSAKIDSGNSGGVVFSKDQNGLCLLGIPTWLSIGNYETQGVVQNIHNIFYKD